jgi:hypothetical protein
LAATNDHCEVHGRMNVGTGEAPLPDLLADLEMPEQEVWQALADLHELGLIKGTTSYNAKHPNLVLASLPPGGRNCPSSAAPASALDTPRRGILAVGPSGEELGPYPRPDPP